MAMMTVLVAAIAWLVIFGRLDQRLLRIWQRGA